MPRLTALLTSAILALVGPRFASAETRVARGPLVPGEARLGAVGPDAVDSWPFDVEAGLAYELRLEQLGADHAPTLVLPGEPEPRLIDETRGRGGDETAFWVASRSGRATLEVRLAMRRTGRYRLTLSAPREAAAADRARDEAERLFATRQRRDSTDAALARLEAVASAFAELRLPRREAVARAALSGVETRRGDDAARPGRSAERCAALAAELGDARLAAECLTRLVLAPGGDADRSGRVLALRTQALQAWEDLGEPGRVGDLLVMTSWLFTEQGDFEQAEAELQRALALLADEGDDWGLAAAANNLGSTFSDRGSYGEALAAFETARAAFQRLELPQEAYALLNLGDTWGNLGDSERALQALRAGLRIAERSGRSALAGVAQLSIGVMLGELGDLEGAERAGQEAVRRLEGGAEVENQGRAEASLGWIAAQRGRAQEAEDRLTRALALLEGASARRGLSYVWLRLGQARLLAGRTGAAAEALQQALRLAESAGMLDLEVSTLDRPGPPGAGRGRPRPGAGAHRDRHRAARVRARPRADRRGPGHVPGGTPRGPRPGSRAAVARGRRRA